MQPFVQTDARESPKTYCPDWFLEFESLFMTAVSRTIRMLAFHFLRKAAEGMMQEMELKLELSAAGASSLLEKNPLGSPQPFFGRHLFISIPWRETYPNAACRCGSANAERKASSATPRRLFSISAVVSTVGSSGLILGREFVGSNWIFPMHSREG